MTESRQTLLTHWARQQLADPTLQLILISGDASFRRYYRGGGLIWVDAPPQTEKNAAFIQVAGALAEAGIPAPRVRQADLQQGFLAVSDLGDRQLLAELNDQTVAAWYGKAIALLPRIAQLPLAAQLSAFDADFMAVENSIFPQWLLERHLGLSLTRAERQLLAECFTCLTDNNRAQPQVAMHRDYHSRNLMVVEDEALALLDFQDMVRGPLTYDLVSLLRDCYIRWPDAVIRDGQAQAYELYQAAGLLAGYSKDEFAYAFDLTGLQRHLKAAGIFARLNHRDGKPGYLPDIPRTLDYVLQVAQRHAPLQDLAHWLADLRVKHKELQCAP